MKGDAVMGKSMDRRYSASSSSSGEIKPVSETSSEGHARPQRDFVKDGGKNYENAEQLKQAWEEQINRNKSLTDHIRIDNHNKSADRLNRYRKECITIIQKYKIEKLNLSREFKAPSEHVKALTAINDTFETYLKNDGVTLTADSTSAHEPNKIILKLDEKIGEIEPKKDIKRSRITRLKDAFRRGEAPKTMSKHVNNEINQFKDTVRATIKENIVHDYIPYPIKQKLAEITFSFIKDFKQYSDQARDKSKGRQYRQEGEASMRDLNKRLQAMSKDLPMWKYIGELQAEIKNVPASTSNDNIPHLEQSLANKIVNEIKEAHIQLMGLYQQTDNLPPDADINLKEAYNRLATLSEASHARKQVHETQAQLKADHGGTTNEEDFLVNTLADELVEKASSAYKDILQLPSDEPSLQKQLQNAHQHFQTTCDQLHNLSKVSHECRQVHEIYAEFFENLSESDKELAGYTLNVAKKSLRHFLTSCEQGNDVER